MRREEFSKGSAAPKEQAFCVFADRGAKAACSDEAHRDVRDLIYEPERSRLSTGTAAKLASNVIATAVNKTAVRHDERVVVSASHLLRAVGESWNQCWADVDQMGRVDHSEAQLAALVGATGIDTT